jgi:two-component system, NarL family, response regulator LiaR
MIRVVICDDQEMVCEGLRAILSTATDIAVIGVGHDGAEAVELAGQHRPDVVLMDLKMPGVNGIQATRQIKDRFPDVRVLALTTYDEDEWVLDAIRAGADGYLLKDTPRARLIEALRGTAAGATHVDPKVAGRLFARVAQQAAPPAEPAALRSLSDRELEVLRLLARGLSNADIARRLYLSEGTVRNYVSGVLAKLEVADRTQAAILALQYGVVGPEDHGAR